MIRRTIILCCLFVMLVKTEAQIILKPLRIADTIPDMELKMVNYKKPTTRLGDYKGKLLILDFWSRWCSVCIAQFPKMEALQKQFGDKIVILPVGYESGIRWDNIQKFYDDRKSKNNPIRLPSAVQHAEIDTVLRQLFPFNGMPILVWIDFSGRVIGITTYHALTKEAIEVYLHEQNRQEDFQKQLSNR